MRQASYYLADLCDRTYHYCGTFWQNIKTKLRQLVKMLTIIYPEHYRIFECRNGRWFAKNPEPFYGINGRTLQEIEAKYNISSEQVVLNLFRINGGKAGYYLANLRDRTYHYCGTSWQDIKTKLRELGIGRDDPMEESNATT
jgi:hypothetical protein